MRVTNSLSLALCAAQQGLKQQAQHIQSLIANKEINHEDLMIAIGALTATSENVTAALDEAQVNATDLFKLQADSFLNACQDRKCLWVNSSLLEEDYKHQLIALPVQIPQVANPQEHCMLSPEGMRKIKDWSDLDVHQRNLKLQEKALDVVNLKAGPSSSSFKQPQITRTIYQKGQKQKTSSFRDNKPQSDEASPKPHAFQKPQWKKGGGKKPFYGKKSQQ